MILSDNFEQFAAALAKAQGEFTNPPKNRTVKVKTRDRHSREYNGEYSFDYATLDAVLDVVRKPLSANGIALTQVVDGNPGEMQLTTLLIHSSGQFMRSTVPILPDDNGPQALGSAITYLRRYVLQTMLGLCAEEDDDGNNASGNESDRYAKGAAPPANRQQPKNDQRPKQENKPASQKPRSDTAEPKDENALDAADEAILVGLLTRLQNVANHEELMHFNAVLSSKESVIHNAKNKAAIQKAVDDAIGAHVFLNPLTPADNLIVAEVVKMFAEAKTGKEYDFLVDRLKADDSPTKKANNYQAVRKLIWNAVEGHRPKDKENEQPTTPGEPTFVAEESQVTEAAA